MIPLDQLTVAELRDICRQHGLPESYDADQMRHDIRWPHRSYRPTTQQTPEVPSTMFPYFGGKTRLAPTYPAPLYDTIIEPFAGGAGYAMHWLEHLPHLELIVVELNPIIADLWRCLIEPGAAERVEAMPDIKAGDRTSDPLVALSNSSISAINTIRNGNDCAITEWHARDWPRHRANIARRCRLFAGRVQLIEGDYTAAPTQTATWFIDPPYQTQGTVYAESADAIDFQHLADWCRNRRGQVIVSEAEPADWLPFEPHRRALDQKAQPKTELVWYDADHAPLRLF